MHNIQLERRVIKYIASRPQKHQSQLKNRILDLINESCPSDSKQLKGFDPYRRIDFGEYRIIYKIEDKTIFVILVGKRNDEEVYKIFKRLF